MTLVCGFRVDEAVGLGTHASNRQFWHRFGFPASVADIACVHEVTLSESQQFLDLCKHMLRI